MQFVYSHRREAEADSANVFKRPQTWEAKGGKRFNPVIHM